MDSRYLLPIFLAGTLVLVLFALFLIIYLLIQKAKQNRFALEKQQMKFDHENELMRMKLEANEHTMKQISEEIHDNVGQILFQAELNTTILAKKLEYQEAGTSIARTGDLVRRAMTELRNLSHLLNGTQIQELGLIEALKRDVNHIAQTGAVQCSLEVSGEPRQLKGETELIIFRIAQEAIGNALKHAQATSIKTELHYDKQQLYLTVTDDGKGFSQRSDEKNGLGLMNMKQRAKVIDAQLEISSMPGAGSNLTLIVDI